MYLTINVARRIKVQSREAVKGSPSEPLRILASLIAQHHLKKTSSNNKPNTPIGDKEQDNDEQNLP